MFLPAMTASSSSRAVRYANKPMTFFLMTALRDPEVTKAAIKHKADGILLKPFTVQFTS
jgi:DNA-binding NarL/FixJ family response regulator